MENRIDWLSPIGPPENIITDASGNEIILTPEELVIIKAHEQAEEESIRDLMAWGGFQTVEEAEAFLAENELSK